MHTGSWFPQQGINPASHTANLQALTAGPFKKSQERGPPGRSNERPPEFAFQWAENCCLAQLWFRHTISWAGLSAHKLFSSQLHNRSPADLGPSAQDTGTSGSRRGGTVGLINWTGRIYNAQEAFRPGSFLAPLMWPWAVAPNALQPSDFSLLAGIWIHESPHWWVALLKFVKVLVMHMAVHRL